MHQSISEVVHLLKVENLIMVHFVIQAPKSTKMCVYMLWTSPDMEPVKIIRSN